jgi:hypothetical protein
MGLTLGLTFMVLSFAVDADDARAAPATTIYL